jgi:hypothetical protein
MASEQHRHPEDQRRAPRRTGRGDAPDNPGIAPVDDNGRMALEDTRDAPRQEAVGRVHRIADGYASGFREGLTRAQALTEIAAVSADPDLLAEAAAAHATADNWYAIIAVDLLLSAGADHRLMQRHIERRGPPHPVEELQMM